MSRKKRPLPLFENVEITGYAAEGKAVARVGDMVVFAPWCVPGDIADVQVKRKKHSYCEAEAARFHKLSPLRREPLCQHFGCCGGCRWQNIEYAEELRMKQRQVEEQLRRIGQVELPSANPILGSKKEWGYRNKLDFGCSARRWLTPAEIATGEDAGERRCIGFHISGAFDKIMPVERCLLMDDLHNRIRNAARDYAIEHGMSFFDLREQHGLLRGIIIRNSASGEWMVTIQFRFAEPEDRELAEGLMRHLEERFPEISTLLWVDNQKCNDTFQDLPLHTHKGCGYITELMGDLRFKVGPKSFYQTNTEQAHELYKAARRLAGLTGTELVYDLYTGTGTIACFVASEARQVIGIEYVPEAIEDARANSAANNISNTLFYAGDMKDILTDSFIHEHGCPDVVITDPPRAGMHPDVVAVILRAAPQRIVYVSCNPATQARDIKLLSELYAVKAIQPVDMFPHTPHVENIALLERKQSLCSRC